MPTYEYVCKQCGEHVEVVQSFKDEALTTCANCGGTLRKVFGSIGITFKGSGFYRTDSRPARSEKVSSDGSKPKSGDSPKPSESKSSSSSGSSGSSSSSGSSGSGGSKAEAG